MTKTNCFDVGEDLDLDVDPDTRLMGPKTIHSMVFQKVVDELAR